MGLEERRIFSQGKFWGENSSFNQHFLPDFFQLQTIT
jgi:hypothetical protein